MKRSVTTIPSPILFRLEKFAEIARSKQMPLYYNTQTGAESDIQYWPPKPFDSLPNIKGIWKSVEISKGIKEVEIVENVVCIPLLDAIDMYTKDLQEGIFDVLNTFRTIFLVEKDAEGNALKLVCHRYGNGKIRLCLRRVNLERGLFQINDSWFSKN